MKRALLIAAALVAVLLKPSLAHDEVPGSEHLPEGAVAASHGDDEHSDNMAVVGRFDADGEYRTGTDLAFWGDLLVAGNYNSPGGFRLLDISDPTEPSQVAQFVCPGPQNDVSIFRDVVIMSVDSAQQGPECGGTEGADTWEGIRVVSISERENPVQVAAVATDCGSHTHTLVPDPKNHRLLVYALSYPLRDTQENCNATTHSKISVVEVPLRSPADAEVISEASVSPAIGCHDVTVYPERDLAAAACISESQMWDISDPENPTVIAHIVNPAVNIHHSTAFSWDGDTIVIGDELGGAAASPGCSTSGSMPLGALWFYDVSDPENPSQEGNYVVPRNEASAFCTAHNFNVIPLRSGRDVLVSAWYNGGTTIIDFTDPAQPEEIAWFVGSDGGQSAAWSSYWYNDHIYVNNFDEDVNSLSAHSRGIDVLRLNDDEILSDAVSLRYLNPQTQERPKPVESGNDGPPLHARAEGRAS